MNLFKALAGVTPSTSHGNHQTPTRNTQSHLIFRLPEILELILSFLSTHALRHGTSLVCRRWRELSLSLLLPPVTALWTTCFYTNNQEGLFREYLAICRHLRLKCQRDPYDHRTQEEREASWDRLHEAVMMQCLTNKSFRITQLTVEGNFPIATRLEPLLVSASLLATTLTTIRIENFKEDQVLYIDQILSVCVNLIDLHLESSPIPMQGGAPDPTFGGITSIELREGSKFWMERMKTPLKIQRLAIKHLSVSQQLMEAILPHCPFVKSLEIYACDAEKFHGGGTYQTLFELPTLYRLIARCLPSLEHIHVSFVSHIPWPNDVMTFRQVFDGVKSWSFAHEDIEGGNLELLLMPTKPRSSLYEPTFPMLTRLDIQAGSTTIDIHETLHAYLVSPAAASLVHLKAGDIPYWCGYFNPHLIQQHNMWTCRRLQTLQLHIWHRDKDDLTWTTRVVFGYLTQFLPRMRNIRLHYPEMVYDLDGGFCLLRRMRYLEQVHIVSQRIIQFEEKDLYWLIRRPSPTQKLKRLLWVTKLRLQSNVNQKLAPNDIQMQVEPVDGIIPRISSLGSLEDLIECLEDDNGSSGGGVRPDNLGRLDCLPYLESLVMARFGVFLWDRIETASITQMMKSLRPDCAFRVEWGE